MGKADSIRRAILAWALWGALVTPLTSHAQETPPEQAAELPAGHILPDSASPFGDLPLSEDEIAGTEMPKIEGPVTPLDEADFDKYYIFNRPETDVKTAFADISECDGYAKGLATSYRYQQAPYPYSYTMAGAVGGAIGNVMVAAIFGSAEKRRMRRINMRACMGFKGYERFGLPKNLWEKFNFEEGLDGVSQDVRQRLLLQQAMVAAGAKPTGKVLEP